MKHLFCLVVITIAVSSAVPHNDGENICDAVKEKTEEENKRLAIQMMQDVFGDKDVSALDKYIDAEPHQYIQHNPNAIDGRENLKQILYGIKLEEMPKLKLEVQRVAADGDIVFYHWKSTQLFGKVNAKVEIFKFKNGKIIEHWDLIQEYPERSRNDHPLF